MSQLDPETARLIDQEAEHAEATRDDPYPPGVVGVRRDVEKVRRALDKLGETVERILEETGMTEEELATLFDLRRPYP